MEVQEIAGLLKDIDRNLELAELIGRGGQKQVYKAVHRKTGQVCVFKILEPNVNGIERLRREIRAVTVLSHPNVPKVFASNVDEVCAKGGAFWCIEEFIPGKALRAILESRRKFSINEIILFLETMFSVLTTCEQNRIVHRDIKPENIILDDFGKFWLIDFGISRHLDLTTLTDSGSPFGPCTFGYAASEQFRNRKREIDIRADLFSVGVVAAEMITGQNPYLENTTDLFQLIKKIEQQPLPMLRIEGDNEFMLAKFIKTIGDNRYTRRPGSMREVIELLNIVKCTLSL